MHKFCLVLLGIVMAMSGCAGVSIRAVSGTPDKVRDSLMADKKEGYVIYHPMIVFEVVDKEVCLSKAADGSCAKLMVTCALGNRYVLPDYDQPYVVQISSGFGKAGADISFTDGWLLSNVKDNSDNTALVEALFKAAGLGGYAAKSVVPPQEDKSCTDRGLYRYKLISGKPALCRFWGPGNSSLDC